MISASAWRTIAKTVFLRTALRLLNSECCSAGRRDLSKFGSMKKQGNTQLALALLLLVGFVLLLVDSIRTSPLTFTFAKEPPLPVISNDPDGHMPYTWELDPVDNAYNPHYFADHFHVPLYAR